MGIVHTQIFWRKSDSAYLCNGTHFPMSPHHFSTIHMGPIPAPARSTFPIDTPNHEHGHYDDDEDIDEEAPTGDTDITAT